jgi:carboxyl-terminal processing protease
MKRFPPPAGLNNYLMIPQRSRVVVALGILTAALVSGGWLFSHGLTGGGAPFASERLFDNVFAHVQRFYIDSLSTGELFDRATKGMLQELGDPNTVYLRPDRLRRLTESTSGVYTGLGVRFDSRDGWPMIMAPLPGGPGERAGLIAGDRLVEIAGRSTKGWTDEETAKALRGDVGTSVQLVVERPGQTRRITLTLTRTEIHRQAVRRTALLDNGVGYVDVKMFTDSTERELAGAIDSLSGRGMKSLVLDLRANPGGLLTQGVAVADLFLDEGQTIVSMRGRVDNANRSYSDEARQRWPGLPLLVLVDDASASASEIVAGALQDHDRALVMGQTTYGKGSAQAVFQLSVGGGLKITTARWYTPSGRSIDRTPEVSEEGSELARREQFRTDAGRAVFGGGGITPDVIAGDTALSPGELALQNALGARITDFRDALTAYAISLRGRGVVASPDFTVTARMFDGAWNEMRSRGFTFERSIFDGARPLVARLLAREIVRLEFGREAEARRSIADDDVIQQAVRALTGVTKPGEVFRNVLAVLVPGGADSAER